MKYTPNALAKCLCALLTALICLCTFPCTALCEFAEAPSIVIVSFDRAAMDGWMPGYGLNAPGVLLELSHAEAMLSITAVEKDIWTPESYLEDRLDRAGETLSVENAQMGTWTDSLDGDGRVLTFSYTYPEGNEVHLMRIYAAGSKDMLIELSIDTWGEESELLMDSACAVFIENGFSLVECAQPLELMAALSDIIEDENGRTHICLSAVDENQLDNNRYYPLSENAVVLFPNPDDPSMLHPVATDMISLIDAVLTYEENSDGPAVFYCIIENEEIVYMEYSLLIP